ncbi:hypothetical protein CN692_07080 [Bacillus sp. AFS002410]|uniref:hypothetical protein n=1 Tax=Bacillus sp. AFS002410 TaxID=2033481 RepID=UPI000BF111F5|nr:hypothetical protein [Bacillus sp. AFS002410]PEJ59235.1 hypothetical protein CN692_07080 [Bacillus sp. AFS002410]
MKKMKPITIFMSMIFILSAIPTFNIVRETVIGNQMEKRYQINDVYPLEENGKAINPTITVQGNKISFKEDNTGKTEPLSDSDIISDIKRKEVVKLHLFVNGHEITKPDAINVDTYRNKESEEVRYNSWIGIMTVKDRETKTNSIKIVQRLSKDEVLDGDRKWKIITIDQHQQIKEETFEANDRGESSYNVEMINNSGTSLMGMGYHSDILEGWPSIFFPIVFPFGSLLVSTIALVIIFFRRNVKGEETSIT